jgi:hypothetical protein
MRSLTTVLFAKYNWNDLVKNKVMGRACRTNGEKRNACGILLGKPERKRPLGRPRCKCVDNKNWILEI